MFDRCTSINGTSTAAKESRKAMLCEAAWIQHDKVDASNLACLDLPYQLMLGIALKGFELMALLPGKLDQFLI